MDNSARSRREILLIDAAKRFYLPGWLENPVLADFVDIVRFCKLAGMRYRLAEKAMS